MIAVITSKKDTAGINIRSRLLKDYNFTESDFKFNDAPVYKLVLEHEEVLLFTLDKDPVFCENIDRQIPADLFVFATRHFSSAGVPALTAHAVGNWGKAEFGGRERTLVPSPSRLLKLFVQNLAAVAKSEGYEGEVVQESTHHGPYLEKPAVFIEVGSTEKEWKNGHLGSVVADSLIGGLGDYACSDADRFKTIVGLGGPHYARSFTKLMLETDYAVGHVCPKHQLASLDAAFLQAALAACNPESKRVALDWKGLGSEKSAVKELLDATGIEHFRT